MRKDSILQNYYFKKLPVAKKGGAIDRGETPNLNKIIKDNLDKTGHIPNKTTSGLPKDQLLNQYKKGGGMFPEYHSYTAPRMANGGGLLNKTVTCSKCGHSWKGVIGGMDPLTCHNCGGMIKMRNGGDPSIPDLQEGNWLSKYQTGKEVGDEQDWGTAGNAAWTAAQIADPTGVLSYGDAYRGWKDMVQNPSLKNFGWALLNTAAALPVVGEGARIAKLGTKAGKAAKEWKELNALQKVGRAANKTILHPIASIDKGLGAGHILGSVTAKAIEKAPKAVKVAGRIGTDMNRGARWGKLMEPVGEQAVNGIAWGLNKVQNVSQGPYAPAQKYGGQPCYNCGGMYKNGGSTNWLNKYDGGGFATTETTTVPPFQLTPQHRKGWEAYRDYLDKQGLYNDPRLNRAFGKTTFTNWATKNPQYGLNWDVLPYIGEDLQKQKQQMLQAEKKGNFDYYEDGKKVPVTEANPTIQTNLKSKNTWWPGTEFTSQGYTPFEEELQKNGKTIESVQHGIINPDTSLQADLKNFKTLTEQTNTNGIPKAKEGMTVDKGKGKRKKDKGNYVDLKQIYNLDPFSKEGIAKAQELTKSNPNTRIICTAAGCSEIAVNAAKAFGHDFKRSNAWDLGNKNKIIATNPVYKNLIGKGILPDPQSYISPESVYNHPGAIIGLNRRNNLVGGKATNIKEADDSFDYGNQTLYPGSRGYEHAGYMIDENTMLHGTGAGGGHPAYYVIDPDVAGGVHLTGYGDYQPVEAMMPNQTSWGDSFKQGYKNIKNWFGFEYGGMTPDIHEGWLNKYAGGGMITDPRGQWAHPGQNTRIPGGNITMQGVNYPVLAKASNGMSTVMQPGQNYNFQGASHVDEYPLIKRNGGEPNWLGKYIK